MLSALYSSITSCKIPPISSKTPLQSAPRAESVQQSRLPNRFCTRRRNRIRFSFNSSSHKSPSAITPATIPLHIPLMPKPPWMPRQAQNRSSHREMPYSSSTARRITCEQLSPLPQSVRMRSFSIPLAPFFLYIMKNGTKCDCKATRHKKRCPERCAQIRNHKF